MKDQDSIGNPISVRLPEKTRQDITEYSNEQAVSTSDAVRRLIEIGLDEEGDRHQITRDFLDSIYQIGLVTAALAATLYVVIGSDYWNTIGLITLGALLMGFSEMLRWTSYPEKIDRHLRQRFTNIE